MLAAVIHGPSEAPRAEPFADPTPQPGESIVRVLAAGLHPLVRGHAAGKHYTSTGQYPLIPGVDGVCELPDGRAAYFGWQRAPYGTFAERAVVHPNMVLPLPDGADPKLIAGIVNPAMSGWLALRFPGRLEAGQNVAILGATGAAGGLAVQVARAFGAGRVVACGRNAAQLEKLNADAIYRLDSPEFRENLTRDFAAHGVDVVLDYVWGPPIEATLDALLAARKELGTRRVRVVNIGEMAGARASISPHVVRSMKVELHGSGFGSIAPNEIAVEIPKLVAAAARGELAIELDPVPLARVAEAWAKPAEGGKRVVIVP